MFISSPYPSFLCCLFFGGILATHLLSALAAPLYSILPSGEDGLSLNLRDIQGTDAGLSIPKSLLGQTAPSTSKPSPDTSDVDQAIGTALGSFGEVFDGLRGGYGGRYRGMGGGSV